MGICSFSSPQPIGVSFRFRKCKFSNNSRNAIQHSAVDIWSGLPAPARDFHRTGSPRLQVSRWQIALLGILLEGLSGNRHRLPHQEPSHNRSPAVLRLISNRVLVQCQSGANASCGCLPPQRRGYSNRVLAQCPVGLPMPPAAVCHLSAAERECPGRRPKTISRRDVSPRPRRRRGSLRSGAQPSSPAPFRRE